MSTTARSQQFLPTMLVGLAMAAGIHLFGEPALAWFGFAMAGILRAATPQRGCITSFARRSGA